MVDPLPDRRVTRKRIDRVLDIRRKNADRIKRQTNACGPLKSCGYDPHRTSDFAEPCQQNHQMWRRNPIRRFSEMASATEGASCRRSHTGRRALSRICAAKLPSSEKQPRSIPSPLQIGALCYRAAHRSGKRKFRGFLPCRSPRSLRSACLWASRRTVPAILQALRPHSDDHAGPME